MLNLTYWHFWGLTYVVIKSWISQWCLSAYLVPQGLNFLKHNLHLQVYIKFCYQYFIFTLNNIFIVYIYTCTVMHVYIYIYTLAERIWEIQYSRCFSSKRSSSRFIAPSPPPNIYLNPFYYIYIFMYEFTTPYRQLSKEIACKYIYIPYSFLKHLNLLLKHVDLIFRILENQLAFQYDYIICN